MSALGASGSSWTSTLFRHTLRRYQGLALDAFEASRAAGRRRAYIVMPPGSGKTAVGLEIARRLGRRTLVLTPNTAVQSQWLLQWGDFEPHTVAAGADRSLHAPLSVLTYQSLCTLRRTDALDASAVALWRDALQQASGIPEEASAAEIDELAASAPAHHAAELARYRRHARRLALRGGERAELLRLLHPNGRALVERMRATGPWTLVLDECHHLLEMWGHLVRAVADEAGADTFVLGLTATPPGEMGPREAALYRDLFGVADFEIPTPAVVKEGELAPYQELAFLTRPLPHERDFIASQHERFERLLDRLTEVDFGSRPFLDWVQARVVERRSRSGAAVSWLRFERDHPRLATAALRLLHRTGAPPPAGVRPRERHRVPPDAGDWVALIEDYAMRHLKPSPDPRDADAWEEIRAALPSLGYLLTRSGIRAHRSPVDRVLALSASKGAAALEILEVERRAMGDGLRALVLCDFEHASAEATRRLEGVLDPRAGSAALVLHLLATTPGTEELNPILMTGRTVACSRSTAEALAAWIEARVERLRGAVRLERLPGAVGGAAKRWDDIVVVRPADAWWRPRHYVPLVTRYFEEGHARCLIGTRALLGEGWDAKRVNALIDLTAATTRTSVHQLRGRSLRLDPQDPLKLANNWDVVCVDPEHPGGAADYARFVRKHHHRFAPTAEGDIESGVSHVHHELSPYAPPPASEFARLNAAMMVRAADRAAAHARWRIGEPYENAQVHTAWLRFGRPIGLPDAGALRRIEPAAAAPGAALRRRVAGVAGAGAAVGIAAALVASPAVAVAAGVGSGVAGAAWLLRRLRHRLGRLGPSDALEDLAAAVADGLAATGGIQPGLGAEAVRVVVEGDGYHRCYLAGATEAESRRFAESLDELLSPLVAPRYLIPRHVADAPRSSLGTARVALRLLARGRIGRNVVWHTVPAYLAANRARADAFAAAWNRHVSAGEPLFWKDPRAQGVLAVQQGEDLFAGTTQMRMLWR